MNYHIDPNDAKYQNAASQILARHNNNEAGGEHHQRGAGLFYRHRAG